MENKDIFIDLLTKSYIGLKYIRNKLLTAYLIYVKTYLN